MTWQLIRRDPAWRCIPLVTLALAAFFTLWHFFAKVPDLATTMVFSSALAGVLLVAAWVATQQQSDTRLQITLPVTVRQVFLARLISMLALVWLPVVAGVTVLNALHDPEVAAVPLALWAVFTIATMCIQAACVRGIEIPYGGLIGTLMVVWVLASTTMGLFHYTAAAPLLLAVCCLPGLVVIVRTWQVAPESFQTASTKLSAPTPRSITPTKKHQRSSVPWWPVLRALLGWRGLSIPFLTIWMILNGGQTSLMILIFAGSLWQQARTNGRWLFDLPIPRRALLPVFLLPTMFALVAGYEISLRLPAFPSPYNRDVMLTASQKLPLWGYDDIRDDCKTQNVLPSIDYWLPAKSVHAPVIRSPWGETFQPPTHTNSGFDIYNPYAVGCDNSERFLDWQFARATTAVYGHPIPHNDVPGNTGLVVVTDLRTQLIGIFLICGYSTLALLMSVFNDWRRFRNFPYFARQAIYGLAIVAVCWIFFLDVTHRLIMVQWLAWSLPESLQGTLAILLPILATLLWTINTLLKQLELVDKPTAPPA